MKRRRVAAAAALTGLACAVACSFPDVNFGPGDGGSDATLSDAPIGDAPIGDGSGEASDGGSVFIDSAAACGATEKRCGVACVSDFDPSHGCARAASCDPCAGPAHGTSTCPINDASCAVACDTPWQDCDKDAANGCEVDPTSGDGNNCGVCGRSCDGGVCMLGGNCGASCGDAATLCNNTSCVDTMKDPKNCGGCGKTCDAGTNQTASCDASACAFACDPGTADCNKQPVDGCEANLLGSTATCGSCQRGCDGGANTGATCNNGSCLYGCLTGFNDCANGLADGCECQGGPVCPGRACANTSDCCGGKQCLTAALLPCLGVGCACR